MASSLRRLFKAAKFFIRHRRKYISTAEAWNAMKLRLAAVGEGQPAGDGDLVAVRLAGLPHETWVRRGTSDFLVIHSLFEKEAYRAVHDMKLPRDGTVIDLGGNIGLSVLYFWPTMPVARYIVVEPDAPNCRLIEKNCRFLKEAGRLDVVPAFVGEKDGFAGIDRTEASWAFRKTDSAGGESIACISMPTLLAQAGVASVDLLKSNIEGTEAELFRDCRPCVGAIRNMIVECHRPYTLEDLYAALRRNGWEFEVVWQRQRSTHAMCFLAGKR